MSGPVPNGPCSNDVDAEEVPCRPFLLFVHDDDDDEPPLLTQVIDFVEATTTSSAPTTTITSTEAAAADKTADGAVDASSTVSDATSTPGTGVEEPQIDTAEEATDSSINLDTHTGNNKEDVSDTDNTLDASDSTNNEVDAAEPGANDTSVGAAETARNPDIDTDEDGMEAGTDNTEDITDDADNGADVELPPGVDNATDEAADNDVNSNSAIDTAAVDNTAAGADEKNNDADTTAANTDVVAGTADNSDNPDAAIESDEEQKVDEGDNTAGANANHGAVDDIDKEQDSEVDGGNDSTVDWNEFAEELQMENNEVSELSPTVNGESSSGNEAVGTGSNASGSTTSYVTSTEDNLVVEEEEEAKVDSGSASTPVTVAVEETTQTLYTSADASNPKPDDVVKVLLRFDYDLTTASNFNGDTLSILEDSIASDLAQIYGLIAVSTSRRVTKRRRYLRKLTVDDVMALDSQPVDVNVANTYECQDQDIDPNFTCTPISGFMTAYLGPESDEEASKTAILSSVEQGMELGTYEDNEIIKVTYIGTRSNRDDMTSTELRLEQQTSLSNESALAIGLSAFFLVFAALVSFIALNNREKKKRRSSDNSMGASAEMS
ncbi:hypothetical protein QTG54_007922 [Skeletonema marinoi]|uniref:Uncharacterized protein n=1 Tax=Skeletonema marinoi TaxID=267567 RepID=A0AAD8Y7W7_9STRA|nr:hypothetical protein QTG54_007922 [Skeletonema marinoi]